MMISWVAGWKTSAEVQFMFKATLNLISLIPSARGDELDATASFLVVSEHTATAAVGWTGSR